jgi:UrcA family protein
MNTTNTSTQLRRLVATAILGAFAAGFAGLSTAADTIVQKSVTVKYGDLNLSNPKGASALYSRIVSAAHEVCDMPEDFRYMSRALACRDKAIKEAVTKIGNPGLIAVYNSKNREPLPATVAAR